MNDEFCPTCGGETERDSFGVRHSISRRENQSLRDECIEWKLLSVDLKTQLLRMTEERDRLRDALIEASEWLCAHPDCPDTWTWDTRYWCAHCHQYVRSEDEFTLRKRMLAAIHGKAGGAKA